MTYIVGIANEQGGCLSADNIVTFSRPVQSLGATSSGRTLTQNRLDSAFKITKLSENCILTFAGNVEVGEEVIEELKKTSIYSKHSVEEALRNFKSSTDNTATFLICIFDTNEAKCFLLKWETSQPSNFQYGKYFFAGSGSWILKPLPDEFVSQLLGLDRHIRHLSAVLAFHFNMKVFHTAGKELSREGVGGCFFGLSVNKDGCFDQGDTAILRIELIPNNGVHIPIIKLAYRKGVLFINSSISGEKKALMNTNNCTESIVKSFEEKGMDALTKPDFDIAEIWDIENIENLEIHFEYDNLPSQYMQCDPGEYLKFGQSRDDVVPSKKLLDLIQDLRDNGRY